jgi:hypothetical protein
MDTNTICLNINNNISTLNNKYIINDISSITTYGLYINDGSYSQAYYLENIPRNKPLRFFIDGCNNSTSDISHIVEVSYNGPTIPIYVSKGNDISFNNGDYFRFYDESFNLININNHNSSLSSLTNINNNFYFMNDVNYQFIATSDFSSAFPFSISGNGINNNTYKLLSSDNSFIINIPSIADNSSNNIFYIDLCNVDISGDLFIAIDNNNNKYYYDNIRFNIKPEIRDNTISLSIISISNSGYHLGGDISNIDFFKYISNCNYIIDGTNIEANQLSNLNQECLNIISKADFSSSITSYIFNVGNHFTGNDSNIPNLTYVIYDTTYYILDICINYPIKVSNDFSNVLLIDPSYIDENTFSHKSVYHSNTYYYGAIKLKVATNNIYNNGNNLTNALEIYDGSNITFIYSDQCSNPNSVNQITNKSRFNLINQYYTEFSNNFYDTENHYSLNIYENYIEPSNNGFIAIDEYGHNLSNLVNTNRPEDLSSILTRTNNYNINNFLITYNLTSYDEQTSELYRYVKINYGPFIEISGLPLYYYKDDNSFNNIINISNNLEPDFDLSNIVVYLKNGINNRINLKFDITFLENNYYPINSTNSSKNLESFNILDISYNKKVIFPNIISGQKYYLSRNLLHFNYKNINNNNNSLKHQGTQTTNQNPLVLKDISNLTFYTNNSNQLSEVSNNLILKDKFILSFSQNDSFNAASSKSYIDYSNNSNEKYLTFFSKSAESTFEVVNIKEQISYPNLDISFGLIELLQTDNSDNLIHTKLYLNNSEFIIDFSFINTELYSNNITISGDFLQPKIFDTQNIDISYIGNYQIKIIPLGLSVNDIFYNTISNIPFSSNIISSDISKIYNINVIDKTKPIIQFKNTGFDSSFYTFDFPKDSSFHLIPTPNNFDTSNSLFFLSDTCYNDFIENSLKPIIVFDDDSIYNVDLSYNIYDVCNIKLPIINNVLTISDNTLDASAVIQYIGIDLCGNPSNDISLTILFKNIPQLSLSGQITEPLEVGDTYIEPGILIDNNFYNFNNLSLTGPFTDFCNNKVLGSKQYNISFISDLCLNQVGIYDISYIVSFNNETSTTILKRFIKVEDNTPPFILFPDLSLINYDFSNTNNISTTLSDLSSSNISYAIDNSDSIIDFSLSLFSNISDLSKIIYDFSLVDNYSKYIDQIGVNISLEIISITGDVSSINLITNNLNDITTFLNVNSYINTDGNFIILTQSSDYNKNLSYSYYKPELSFNYIITDICNNSFNFTRKVNIINYDNIPNIFFTKDSLDITIIETSNNIIYNNNNLKKDFSYQALSYIKDPSTFIYEISNILFNFDVSDQFSELYNEINLNNNVLISISSNNIYTYDPSIIRLHNLNDSCFNDISNILEQFSIIDNSFQLIYDFSNNQNLSNSITRNVTIINTISCEISANFSFPGETSLNTINISFGNTDFLFTKYFTLSHPRLTSEDVSFELSYNATPNQDFSSLIGEDISFNVSALIYQYTVNSNIKSYNFSFYNTISNDPLFISPNLDISINIIIDPPFLTESSSLSAITHEAGIYISDLSLIENVSFFSKFDEFYYANYAVNDVSISYSETNFTLSFEKIFNTTNEFNQNFPISDLSGDATYNIIYDVSDANDTFKRFTRELKIQDNTPPIITLFDQDLFDVDDFLQFQNFDIAGFSVQDSFSYLKSIDFSVNLFIDNSSIRHLDICNIDLLLDLSNYLQQFKSYSLTFNDISDLTNNFSDIIIETSYKVTDIKDNFATDTNNITLNFSDLVKLNIAILYQDDSFNLNQDFYIPRDESNNWFLKYENSTQTIIYDASTNPINFNFTIDSSNQSSNALLNENIQIIPDISIIDFTDVSNINLYFQLFYIPDSGVPIIKTRILELKIIDKSEPILSFIDNNREIFPNINNIILPEISSNLIIEISNNINFLFDNETSYNYFTKNESNNLIYNIPSIKINDIVNDIILVPNNIEDFSNIIVPNNPNTTYTISISYEDLSNNPLNIDSSNLLNDLSKNFIQIFHVIEENSDNDFSRNEANDISRNITIKRFEPFINITYNENYKKTYHKLYSLYKDLGAHAFDYYDGSNIKLETIKTINENNLGPQQVTYQAKNKINNTFIISRQVHVVDIYCIFFDKTENYNIDDINNDFNNHIRYGLYGTETNELSYNFYIDPLLDTYIALKSYKNGTQFDNYNAISININQLTDSCSNIFYNSYDDCSYVKGKVVINVKNDFNRASLYWVKIDLSDNIYASGNFEDLFLYNESCIYYIVDNDFVDICNTQIIEFSVDVSGNNINNSTDVPYFTISGNNGSNNGSNNELNFNPTPRKTLHLPYGIYGFKQNKFTNFYNKIKFSYLPDGWHFNIEDNSNGDISYIYNDFLLYNNYTNVKDISFNNKNDPSYNIYEYTNNVYSNSLAGVHNKDSYTYLEINATTPSPLYYYSENFSNMGGIIYTKNNISFSKNCVSLNGNILAIDNCNGNIFNHSNFTTNITKFDEISNNLLFLSCRFDLSALNPSETNDISLNKDFIALTQQNITHNIIINKYSNKIIFKKYHDVSSINNVDLSINYSNNNYIIKKDNSYNYLFDSSINFIERYKGNNVLLYKSNIETSANLIETNTINQRLELNALDFFFNNNQLTSNYTNFFSKNKLINNIYKKNNNNQNIYFIKDHFKYKIHEISYENQVKIINGNNEYIFFDNTDLLNSNRLIFEPIFDNLFTFNFQIYLDYNNVNLETNYRNYLKNNIFNKNIYSKYPDDINKKNLFFEELFVSIFSDISGQSESESDISQSIIFSENTIFINEQFLDSSNYPNTIDEAINDFDITSENLIILSGIDNSNNTFCGLTQQNFVHNIDISDANKVIFHKYDFDIFNYQVNDANLTLEKTLLDSSNNNKYFLELSSNDVYNCFIDICENISNTRNLVKKNRLMEPSRNILTDPNFSFNSHITYTIYDEIENNNNYLTNFDVRPIDLYEINSINDLCFNDISYAYANFNNNKNSHSFVINLLDYIDRNLFNNPLISIPANIINYNNINFIIKDISYSDQTKQFNLYDICADQIILYDKNDIAKLNELEAKIYITNLKFEYFRNAYIQKHPNDLSLTDFYDKSYNNFINSLNLQNIVTLFSDVSFITNTYAIKLENKSLNQLYSNVFYNSKILINRYNDLANAFIYYNEFLFPPINNIYEDIRKFDLVDQLVIDISLININIDNKIYQEYSLRASNDNFGLIENDICLNIIEDYNILLTLTQFYLDYKEHYEIIHYELSLRHDIYTTIMLVDSNNNLNTYDYDSSFVELFNNNTINKYYENLISNMINLNDMLLNDISNSVIFMGSSDNSSNIYCDTPQYYVNSKYNPVDISYLSFLKDDISTNFNIILESANVKYDFINKKSIFDNINYVLNGPSIFINAFKSTNILFKIDLFYNSYLFTNVYLDTLVLDVTKPDLIPPTLIFNNNDLTINQSDVSSNINNIIQTLITDISYIELHEESNEDTIFDLSNISYVYTSLSETDPQTNSNDLSLSDVTIIIDISSIGTNQRNDLEVLYTIIDKANNQNNIKRNIQLNNALIKPQLYYPDENTEISNNIIPVLTVNESDNNAIILEKAKNNIILKDSNSTIIITKEDASFNIMLTIDISDNLITYNLSSINKTFLAPIRFIRTLNTIPTEELEFEKTVCCYPPAFYYPIQHNYKLGANATYKMRLAKFIINNHR